jgi:hypothetical protein
MTQVTQKHSPILICSGETRGTPRSEEDSVVMSIAADIKFIGWTRRPGDRWRRAVEGATESEAWDRLLMITYTCDKTVTSADKDPNKRTR